MAGTTLRLLININIGDGHVAIAYGHRMPYSIETEVELTFDSSSEAGWTLIEARYSREFWHTFKWSRRVTHDDSNDEQYFNFDEFAEYVLQRFQQEAWLERAVVPATPQPHEGAPEWLYHKHEPARDSHPATW